MPSPKYLTTQEVADMLGLNVQTVRYYLRTKAIRSVPLGNGPRARRRVPVTAIHEWEKRNTD